MEEITGRGTFADERVEIYDMDGENGTVWDWIQCCYLEVKERKAKAQLRNQQRFLRVSETIKECQVLESIVSYQDQP